jgi:hypothetical protein
MHKAVDEPRKRFKEFCWSWSQADKNNEIKMSLVSEYQARGCTQNCAFVFRNGLQHTYVAANDLELQPESFDAHGWTTGLEDAIALPSQVLPTRHA